VRSYPRASSTGPPCFFKTRPRSAPLLLQSSGRALRSELKTSSKTFAAWRRSSGWPPHKEESARPGRKNGPAKNFRLRISKRRPRAALAHRGCSKSRARAQQPLQLAARLQILEASQRRDHLPTHLVAREAALHDLQISASGIGESTWLLHMLVRTQSRDSPENIKSR
jgi:hypothetical protein